MKSNYPRQKFETRAGERMKKQIESRNETFD